MKILIPLLRALYNSVIASSRFAGEWRENTRSSVCRSRMYIASKSKKILNLKKKHPYLGSKHNFFCCTRQSMFISQQIKKDQTKHVWRPQDILNSFFFYKAIDQIPSQKPVHSYCYQRSSGKQAAGNCGTVYLDLSLQVMLTANHCQKRSYSLGF